MDKFVAIVKREFLERVRTKWFAIATLAVPLLMVGSMVAPALLAKRSQPSAAVRNIVILDATGTNLGQRIAENLAADSTRLPADTVMPEVRVVAPGAAMQAADSSVVESIRNAAVEKREGRVGVLRLTDSTLSTGLASYAGKNASSLTDVDRLRAAVRQSVTIVRLEQASVPKQLVTEISQLSVSLRPERIGERGREGSATALMFVGLFFSMMLYLALILHGQNVLRGVLEEKTTRVAEVVLSSVKPEILLAGKVCGVGAVGLLQVVIWISLSALSLSFVGPMLLRGMPAAQVAAATSAGGSAASMQAALSSLTPQMLAAVISFFLVGFVFYASLYAAVGAMVNSEQEAQQAAMPLIFMLVVPMIFLQSVLMTPNGTLAKVLSWLPFSSPVIMPMRMSLTPLPWYSIWGSILVALLSALAVVWMAARIYRVGMLMYGKRPTLGELAKWIRYA
jgi:ABC-2 type transport system permease protein